MADAALDVVGVGNAIVDVLSQAEDSLLDKLALEKGAMTLIDADRAEDLYQQMGPGIEMSGGSAANTLAGIASLGGQGAYIGKVRDDTLGRVFAHDLKATGVDYRSRPVADGAPTARCLIFVTPDAQRTMQTFLGISTELGPEDIDPESVGGAQVTYLEGLPVRQGRRQGSVRQGRRARPRRRAQGGADPVGSVLRRSPPCRVSPSGRGSYRYFVRQRGGDHLAVRDRRLRCRRRAGARPMRCRGAHAVRKGFGPGHQGRDRGGRRRTGRPGGGYHRRRGSLCRGRAIRSDPGYELEASGRIGAMCAAEIISHYGARPETKLSGLLEVEFG